MSDVLEGEKIDKFLLNDGREVLFRIPSEGDYKELKEFTNKISKEDTYITFSGEELTDEDEKEYLKQILNDISEKDGVMIIAVSNSQIIGYISLKRKTESRMRGRHIGRMGISVDIDYRGVGVGKRLILRLLELTKINIPELKIITLSVYSENFKAINLYHEMGFKEYGVLPGGVWYRERYIDEILMYLNL
jgi:ribosomal protein S18 acetylase RimI-like enzyme